jgi:hypothetical protein
VKRSGLDTPPTTNVWFESVRPPTRTQDLVGERRGYVNLANCENYQHVNPPVQQIRGFQGWLKMDGFRNPCSAPLRFHQRSGGNPTSTCVVCQTDTKYKWRTLRVEQNGAIKAE